MGARDRAWSALDACGPRVGRVGALGALCAGRGCGAPAELRFKETVEMRWVRRGGRSRVYLENTGIGPRSAASGGVAHLLCHVSHGCRSCARFGVRRAWEFTSPFSALKFCTSDGTASMLGLLEGITKRWWRTTLLNIRIALKNVGRCIKVNNPDCLFLFWGGRRRSASVWGHS